MKSGEELRGHSPPFLLEKVYRILIKRPFKKIPVPFELPVKSERISEFMNECDNFPYKVVIAPDKILIIKPIEAQRIMFLEKGPFIRLNIIKGVTATKNKEDVAFSGFYQFLFRQPAINALALL
ncbi:MAG: hypothetical protein LHV69_00745 [Elusimicrobia bacterium]|nr:hypothetical protein [Candidatus Obscuribacterium magneticum]